MIDLEPGDDWKGEHLIRGIVPSTDEKRGYGARKNVAATVRANKRITECRECGKALSARNQIGYCGAHKHLGQTFQKPHRW